MSQVLKDTLTNRTLLGMQAGGLVPLMALLKSPSGNLQHNAAFALYGLADNDDNIPDIVREGGVTQLYSANLIVQVWGG